MERSKALRGYSKHGCLGQDVSVNQSDLKMLDEIGDDFGMVAFVT